MTKQELIEKYDKEISNNEKTIKSKHISATRKTILILYNTKISQFINDLKELDQ